MLQDVIHQTEQLPIDEISSQISAQILEFCDAELFSEPLNQNFEVTCSNCCYEENSSYATSLPLPQEMDMFTSYQDNSGNTTDTTTTTTTNTTTPTGASTTTSTSTTAATTATTNPTTNNNTCSNSNSNNNISIMFDPQEEIDNDISASIDFSPSTPFSDPPILTFPITQQDQFDFTSMQPQISLVDSVLEGFSQHHADSIGPIMTTTPITSSIFEDDCLSSVPAATYMHLNASSPFLAPAIGTFLPTTPGAFSSDSSVILANSIFNMANELQSQDLEYQGENGGIYWSDSMQRVFNPELQRISNESQQLVSGTGNATSLVQDIPNIGDQTFKVGKLSAEQRKEKIHRYMKKRNERNFSKKIKYACRKTLADSRPRVRGRFAKNDDLSETPRSNGSNHEDEDDEDQVVVKEEEGDMVDSSDIFSHITGVNSFKCNFSYQSWSNN